ncbi:AAA family ATPase [Clostridium senegalense]|uniref:HelD family protein n=1 Tax=Clostridium senegalense TaxID=1465809 RepID=UPI001C10A6A0|nr:UvrD-helicase domain-containing protein [Clostridium senegalense]MBU5226307.1 AAA family ATPase [Clostridium senegalense]
MNDELKKELEFGIEKEKLSEVIELINDEILIYLDKRKEIVDYIVEYRKNILDDYKDDEDKLIDYFDHERYVKEEAFKSIDTKLKELNILKTSPYFGNVEFREEDFGIDKIYVGRFGVTPHNTFEPVVVDWRAPVSSLFYHGSLGESHYNAPMGKVDVNILGRRQFIIKKGILEGMFDSAVNVNDDILQMVLSKNSSQKLKDIIMTIQSEQDEIIREDKYKALVVDGVAGSGKTTIALHRVAYLLYNNRESLENKVLILGPNHIFMDYISDVLPSLGESGVKQSTFIDFALEILDLEEAFSLKDVMEKVLNGDKTFIEEIAYKSSIDFKISLDTYIESLNANLFKYEDISLRGNLIISKEDIQNMFEEDFKYMPLFKRSKRIKKIIFSKLKDARDTEFRAIENNFKVIKSKLSKDELILEINDLDFKRKLAIQELIQDIIELKKSLSYLNAPSIMDLYTEFNTNLDLTELDLAAILYLKVKLEGFKLKDEIKHVVIDEAQDYSPVQFATIKEITKCNSFTIVGDSNQRLLPLNGEPAMLTLGNYLNDLEVSNYKLDKSYRSTKEIMDYANNFLDEDKIVPLVRSGEQVEKTISNSKSELESQIISIAQKMRDENLENIAIVTYDENEALELNSMLQNKLNFKLINKDYIKYTHGITIIPSYFAKGLEFDGVILIESNKYKNNYYDNIKKLRYVMATRALHKLAIISTK